MGKGKLEWKNMGRETGKTEKVVDMLYSWRG